MNFKNQRKDGFFGFKNNGWKKNQNKNKNRFSFNNYSDQFKKSVLLNCDNTIRKSYFPSNVVRNENQNQSLKIQNERKNLPIFAVREKLLEAINENDTIIFIGETASGKTTQIPQYIFRDKSNLAAKIRSRGEMIAITQPRRVAAISIANRVAQEMNSTVGQLVGYSVRFDESITLATKIKYLTDGMLLRESLNDPLMKKYACVILDECHERSIITDVLFALVKSAQKQRKDKSLSPLKIIVMSATMDVDHISQYFNDAPVVYLSGRQYPIKIYNSVQSQEDYVHSALVTVFQIHQNEPEGDILVFCTGQEEIESMVSITRDTAKHLPTGLPGIHAFPLYASLPSAQQFRVFEKSPNRKVIFATNVAETSITIPGIKYVIDTGKVKCRMYRPGEGFEMLKVTKISKAQATQRAGRAGRESSGICYRLYTEEEFSKFDDHTIPEILRCNLSSVLLHLTALGIKNCIDFDFMDKPSIESIRSGLSFLQELGALQKINDFHFELSKLGRQMVDFPVDPQFSKILIASSDMGCSEEILSIISLLFVEKIFQVPSMKKEAATEAHKKFISGEGDHAMMLKVFRAFKANNGSVVSYGEILDIVAIVSSSQQWCSENFISLREMKTALQVRQQLSSIYQKHGLSKLSCGQNMETVRKCLATGLFKNVAVLQKEGFYKTIHSKQEVYIHPSSCLFHTKPEVLIYTELIQTSKCYMKNVSPIDYEWINTPNN